MSPRPGMAGVQLAGWEDYALDHSGRELTVYFYSGVEPCYVLDHVEVDYGEQAITVGLYVGSDPDAARDAVCIELAVYKSVTVTLDEPLRGRAVLDAAEH